MNCSKFRKFQRIGRGDPIIFSSNALKVCIRLGKKEIIMTAKKSVGISGFEKLRILIDFSKFPKISKIQNDFEGGVLHHDVRLSCSNSKMMTIA